jgi:hypothetical protein
MRLDCSGTSQASGLAGVPAAHDDRESGPRVELCGRTPEAAARGVGEEAACFPAPHRIHEGVVHGGSCPARRHQKKDGDGDEPQVHATEPPCHKAGLWNERATCGWVDPVGGYSRWKTWIVHLVNSRGYFAITRPSNPGNLNDLRETNIHKLKVPSIWSLLVALELHCEHERRPI